jgi:IS4 transposase
VAIENVHEGNIRELIAGADFADAISFGQLSCRNGVIDVQARLSLNQKPYSLRVVAIEVPDHGLCVFLTNLPRERYPANVVGDPYRLRWEIEKSNEVKKSDLCLDELDCRKVWCQ